jgi:hypothetical protein
MGTDERDRNKRSDDLDEMDRNKRSDADVEAHVHSRGRDEGGKKEPEDSTPDVEAHVHSRG